MRNVNKKNLITSFIVLIIIGFCLLSILTLNKLNDKSQINANINESLAISMVTPSGAPALSLIGVIEDENFNLDLDVVDGADVLTAEFTNEDKDLIIAPINLGNKLIENGAKYKLLSIVTWGNLYIVAPHSYIAEVAAFGEAAVPGKLIEYTKTHMNDNVEFSYYDSVSEAMTLLLSGKANAALLAEPILTMANTKYNEAKGNDLKVIYNLQSLYKEVSGFNSYPQAALFVKNDTIKNRQEDVLNIVNKIRTTTVNYNSNPELIKNLKKVNFENLGISDIELIVNAYPKMAIELIYANECIDEINNFLGLFKMSLADQNYIK